MSEKEEGVSSSHLQTPCWRRRPQGDGQAPEGPAPSPPGPSQHLLTYLYATQILRPLSGLFFLLTMIVVLIIQILSFDFF